VNEMQGYITGVLLGHLTEKDVQAIPVVDLVGNFTEFIDILFPIAIDEGVMKCRITIVPVKGPE
jgi:hypothetical protein